MNHVGALVVPFLAGILLGILFFGGLWYTVRKSLASQWLALWLLASLLFRTAIVLAGLYFIAQNDWRRLVAGLLGFLLGRMFVTRATRLPHAARTTS